SNMAVRVTLKCRRSLPAWLIQHGRTCHAGLSGMEEIASCMASPTWPYVSHWIVWNGEDRILYGSSKMAIRIMLDCLEWRRSHPVWLVQHG
ncbi:Hypothetical predicted protein, partial [Pelobates cultripes]